MSQPFGDLVSQHLHRRHGLSQGKLAAGILQEPSVITNMCNGRRLTGPQARERVMAIITWLHHQSVLTTREEANALLNAAGMAGLQGYSPDEAKLLNTLRSVPVAAAQASAQFIKHSLPVPATQLVGRENDVAAVIKLLKRAGASTVDRRSGGPEQAPRLVTLVGPPGVGKTRLVIEVARQIADSFYDGVCWVELSPVIEPQTALATIAQALGIEDHSSKLALRMLQDHLRDKQMLLVLDNLEQVLEVAPLIGQLLSAAPGMKMMCTSRELLRIAGEQSYTVNPLGDDAVSLFVQRAQAVQPDFELSQANSSTIADICRKLDGLPLAIELAAARIALFTPKEMLSRLNQRLSLLTSGARDLPARQRTLRSTLDWSYELLTTHEQALFRRLGVFAGGLTLNAAQVFCDIDEIPLSAIDGITALIDKNLLIRREVRTGESRFAMLETMREYAVSKLQALGEFAMWTENLAWYLVTRAEVFRGKEFRTLFEESDNWRTTIRSLQARDEADDLEYLLASQCEIYESDVENMRQIIDRSISRAQTTQAATYPLLELYGHLCYVDARVDDLRHGMKSSIEFMKLHDALEVTDAVILSLGFPALIARESGDAALARKIFTEVLLFDQAHGYVEDAINTLMGLGEVEIIDENPNAAIAFLDQAEESLARTDIDDPIMILNARIWISNHRGHASLLMHEFHHAREFFAQSLEYLFQLMPLTEWKTIRAYAFGWNYHGLGETALTEGNANEASSWFRKALRNDDTYQSKTVVTWCLAGLASSCAISEESQRGAKLWGACEALREQIGCRIAPASRINRERTVMLLRSQFGDAAFARLTAEGAKMNVDEAVAFALESNRA